MHEFQIFFQNKRNLVGFIVLVVLILAIPLGIYLVKKTQIFSPKAEETGAITLAEGSCVSTDASGNKVLTCKDVPLRLVAPSFSTFSPSPSPSPSPSSSPSPTVTQKRVFVTSSTFSGNLGGLEGADLKCQSSASAAGVQGTFKAWLSSSTVSASSRLTHATVPYKLLNGTIVANNWSDLTRGSIQNPIEISETGSLSGDSTSAWTNTGVSGEIGNNANCSNWTYGANAANDPIVGSGGWIRTNSSQWTVTSTVGGCAGPARLYCFEQ